MDYDTIYNSIDDVYTMLVEYNYDKNLALDALMNAKSYIFSGGAMPSVPEIIQNVINDIKNEFLAHKNDPANNNAIAAGNTRTFLQYAENVFDDVIAARSKTVGGRRRRNRKSKTRRNRKSKTRRNRRN